MVSERTDVGNDCSLESGSPADILSSGTLETSGLVGGETAGAGIGLEIELIIVVISETCSKPP